MGVVVVIVVLMVVGIVLTKVSDGLWNGGAAAGRAMRRGLSGPRAHKPAPLSFQTHIPADHLRDRILRQIPAAPQAGTIAALHLRSVSPQSISYAYGDVMTTSFTAELQLAPDPAGTRGLFAITNWTQCGGEVKDASIMNDLSAGIGSFVRSADPSARLEQHRS
jgi:hypothetical protein